MANMIEEFRKECEDWLQPLGYSVHSTSNLGPTIIFTSLYVHHRPAIQCFFNRFDEKKCKLRSTGYKMFLELVTGEIQFKHPDIQKYIDVMEHYGMIAEKYPPF